MGIDTPAHSSAGRRDTGRRRASISRAIRAFAAVRPFRALLRLDRAPEQARVLRRKPAELKLHGGDDGALLGELLMESRERMGNRAVLTCCGELLEDAAMIGVDRAAAHAGFPGEGGDG
jgi:hypothetical protein